MGNPVCQRTPHPDGAKIATHRCTVVTTHAIDTLTNVGKLSFVGSQEVVVDLCKRCQTEIEAHDELKIIFSTEVW